MVYLRVIKLATVSAVVLAGMSGCSQQNASTEKMVAINAVTPPQADRKDTEAQARKLMDEVAAKYKGMKSYAESVEYKLPGGEAVKATVISSKPNLLVASAIVGEDSVKAVSNGKTMYAVMENDKSKYLKLSAPPDFKGIRAQLGQKGVAIVFNTANLLTGVHPLKTIEPYLTKISLGPPETINGVPVETVVVEGAQKNIKWTSTYAIGSADRLIYRQVTVLSEDDKTETITETRSDVKANPPVSEATFKFVPPSGALAVRTLVPSNADPRLVEGARPFSFKATALDGKTVTLDQYKGKVLLLDFWATWCGPCIASLPEMQAIYNKFNRREFDILGISLDEDRAQLTSFLAQQKIKWRQVFDGQAWQSPILRQYGVRGIPFTLLIGPDGRIIGVNLMGVELEDAIRQASRKTMS